MTSIEEELHRILREIGYGEQKNLTLLQNVEQCLKIAQENAVEWGRKKDVAEQALKSCRMDVKALHEDIRLLQDKIGGMYVTVEALQFDNVTLSNENRLLHKNSDEFTNGKHMVFDYGDVELCLYNGGRWHVYNRQLIELPISESQAAFVTDGYRAWLLKG